MEYSIFCDKFIIDEGRKKVNLVMKPGYDLECVGTGAGLLYQKRKRLEQPDKLKYTFEVGGLCRSNGSLKTSKGWALQLDRIE